MPPADFMSFFSSFSTLGLAHWKRGKCRGCHWLEYSIAHSQLLFGMLGSSKLRLLLSQYNDFRYKFSPFHHLQLLYWSLLTNVSNQLIFFHYLDDLNKQAFALLDGVPYEFLPNACIVDIKKMLCACKYPQKLKIYSLLPLLSIDSSLLFSLNYIFLYTIYDKLLTLKSLYLIMTQTTHFFMLLPPQPYT